MYRSQNAKFGKTRAASAGGSITPTAGRADAQAVAIYATHYVGPDGGSWTDDSLWRNDATDAPIAPGPSANVTVNNGRTPINAGGQILTLKIGAGSGVTLGNGTLEITGYTAIAPASNFVLSGTLTLGNASTLKYDNADTASQPVIFNGGGRIRGTGDGAKITGHIRNTNSIISGGGEYGAFPYYIQNTGGTFDADTAGLTMFMHPGLLPNPDVIQLGGGFIVYSGLSNVGGTLKATGGGRLNLGGGGGAFDNTGGTVAAIGAGSVVSLTGNAVLRGGTLSTSGGGTFRVDTGQTAYVDAVFKATRGSSSPTRANCSSSRSPLPTTARSPSAPRPARRKRSSSAAPASATARARRTAGPAASCWPATSPRSPAPAARSPTAPATPSAATAGSRTAGRTSPTTEPSPPTWRARHCRPNG